MENNQKDNIKELKEIFKNLSEWKNIPSVSDIQSNINSANEINKYYIDRINDGRRVLEGELPPEFLDKLKPNQSKISPKLAMQQAEWAYGKLTEPFHIANNIFTLNAFNQRTLEYSIQTEKILNFHFNHSLDKRYLIDQAAKSFYDNGVVIGKVSWQSESIEEEIIYTEELEDALGNRYVVNKTEKDTILIENKPYVEICDYDSVIIDPSCKGNLNNANFIVHKYKVNKAKLIKDGRYKNLDKIDLDKFSKDEFNNSSGVVVQEGESIHDSMEFTDKSRKLFDITEYWGMYDIYDTGLLEPILVSFVGDVVVRIELSPMPDKKLPFVAASMLVEEKSIYGKPVSLLIKDEQQLAGNLARNLNDKITESMKNPKLFHPNLFANIQEKNKYIKGLSATTSGQVHPSQGIYREENKDGFDRDIYAYLQGVKQEAQDITGNMPMTQSSGNKFNSANALNAFVDTVAVRESSELGKFAQFWVDISKKIVSMSYEFMEEEEITFITGTDQYSMYPNVPRTIDPYTIEINVITMSAKRDRTIFLLDVLERIKGFADPEFIGVILSKIAMLNDSPDVSDMIKEIINRPPPEPTEEEIMMQQLAMQKQQAEVNLISGQAEDYYATAQLKTSRIGTEQAKQQYTFARADETSQRIVEKNDGTDMARKVVETDLQTKRDLAIINAKAQSSLNSDLIKNLSQQKQNSLDPRK